MGEGERASRILPHPPASSRILPHPLASSRILPHPPASSRILPHPPASSHILPHPPASSRILPHPPASSRILPHPPASSRVLPHSPPLSASGCILVRPQALPRLRRSAGRMQSDARWSSGPLARVSWEGVPTWSFLNGAVFGFGKEARLGVSADASPSLRTLRQGAAALPQRLREGRDGALLLQLFSYGSKKFERTRALCT